MSIYQGISLFVIALIVCGLIVRRQRRAHIAFMLSAFVIDFVLGVSLELGRHVFGKSIGFVETTSNPALLYIHITLATLSFLFYFFQLYHGIRIMKKRSRARLFHRKGAVIFCLLRTGNFITSFTI